MAAPTYATDLTALDDFEGGDNTSEPSGSWTAGRGNTTDTDYPIQSSTHASLIMNTTGKAGILTDASPVTWTSGDYLFGWIVWLAPGAISSQALGGLVMLAGSSVSDFKVFYVGGNDFGSYPYGGWQNFVVDPEGTADETQGTPDGDYDFVGGGANVLSQVSKGSPLGIDVFRYGRGEIQVAAGDGTTPATFAGMATANDASTARWGLFQAIDGGYKWKGLMTLGSGGLVTFEDANTSIVIDNTEFVAADFNAIEIRNASSSVTWENVTMTALGTVSRGTFEVIDNATVVLDGCVFTDMSTFTFLGNSDAIGCTFRRCGLVTVNGGLMTGTTIEDFNGTTGTAALDYDVNADPDGELDDMTFIKGTATTHAIELGPNCPSNITLRGWTVSGYNSANGNNDSVIYNNSAKAITVNVVGNSGTISYRNGTSATTSIVANPVTTEITVRDASTKGLVTGAVVYLQASDGTGPLPFEDAVTITRSASVATVSHTAHGFSVGQKVLIEGTGDATYFGVKTIATVPTVNSYTYAVTGTPANPTSCTSTAVIISATTTATGVVTDSRTLGTDQPISGWVRKATSSPLYKQFDIVADIDNASGYSTTVLLSSDE